MKDFKELIPFRKGHLWGYCDREGNVLLEPKYGILSGFKYELAYFAHPFNPGTKEPISLGIINRNFKIVRDPKNSKIDIDLGQVILDNVLPCEYKFNFFGSKDLINKSNRFRSDQKFRSKFLLGEDQFLGFEIVSSNYNSRPFFKLHFVNEHDTPLDVSLLPKKIKPSVARFLIYLKCQFGTTHINGFAGHYLESGQLAIPYCYNKLSDYFNGVLIAKKEGKSTLISERGKCLTHEEYDEIYFNASKCIWEGMLDNNKYVLAQFTEDFFFVFEYLDNSQNNFIIDKKIADSPRERLRGLLHGKKPLYGLSIEKKSEVVKLIEPCFDSIKLLSDEFAVFELNQGQGVINDSGIIVVPNKYKSIELLGRSLFLCHEAGFLSFTYSFYDSEGNKLAKHDFYEGQFEYLNYYRHDFQIRIKPCRSTRLLVCYIDSSLGGQILLGYVSYKGDKFWAGILKFYFKESDDISMDSKKAENSNQDYFEESGFYEEARDNPWDEVFGPGEEADDANWNTRGE
ncbi:WG repeat-containing protein [Algoriphagus yeomjeoni]|uniref:WG repeat-containing protein n=1 Tax=Algoriphagus yeomjeoni TaxID=291403 RepID=UPI003CE4792E